MQRGYRHVIWDWNGTLVDDVSATLAAINRMLSARGLPSLEVARYREVFDFPVRRYYERLGFDFDRERFEYTCDEYFTHYGQLWPACQLRAGAREALARTSALGLSHSVLSATEHSMLRAQAEHHQLHELIDAWIGVDDTLARGKLAEGRAWLARQALDPAQVVLVGDTLHDLEVARELGVECVLLEGGHHSSERLRASGAHVCSELSEVLALLEGS